MESLWVTVAAAVLVVGVAPGLMVVCRGSAVQRLVGLALLNATGTQALLCTHLRLPHIHHATDTEKK